MRFYEDGIVGISIEPLIGAVRLLSTPNRSGEMTDYIGSGTLVRASHDVAKLIGFSGRMGIRHQALLATALLAQGYKVLYVERAAGGKVALGEPIEKGDFAGHMRVDLVKAAARAAERHQQNP
jgi:hypothetical protein